MTRETRYVRASDGVFLAYQIVGSGPVDVAVDFHAFAGNVDLIWEEPDWVSPPNLENRASDLLAVLDAVGSVAPVLGAAASTGAMHALFAATYPDRTSGIFWNYPRARLAWAPDYPWGQGPEVFGAEVAQAATWGTTEHARELALSRAAQRVSIPDDQRDTLVVDEELVRRYARVIRNTVSPDVAEALTRISWQTDVRDILPSVHTPTALVVGEGDAAAVVQEAEYVASLMPNAIVHKLSGRSGLQLEAAMEIIRGLAGIERRHAVSTVLATVLFTDIVESTRKQAELGDRRWRELLLSHHAAVRDSLADWEGTEHDTAATASSRALSAQHAPSIARTRSPDVPASWVSRQGPVYTSASAR